MTRRKVSPWIFRAAALALMLTLMLSVTLPAGAAVTLTEFTATAQPDGTIRVAWAAATELDTASYQLFRADSASPADWGSPIYQEAAGGSVSPASYQYVDTGLTPGATYWYMLSDISVQGAAGQNGPVSARVPLPNEPTSTPTATATTGASIPTATTGPGGGSGGVSTTATFTAPPPTATQRFTNTPPAPVGTPVLASPTPPLVVNRTTPTVQTGAALATPTGQARIPTTAPAGLPPTALPPTAALINSSPLAMPTPEVVAQTDGAGLETATPVPTREVTPIIFAASETRTAGETPASDQAVASQGSRNASAALVVGGAALGLAGIAAAAWLFLRSRKA